LQNRQSFWGYGVSGSAFKAPGLSFVVQDSGRWVWVCGSGFRVRGSRLRA